MNGTFTAKSNANLFGRLLDAIRQLIEHRNLKATERHLESLDDYMLKDIGISRCAIHSIIRDPRRAPANLARRRATNLPAEF